MSSITLGTEYIATYTFYCQTREEQEKVSAALDAEGVGLSGSVSVSITTALTKVRNEQQIRSTFNQTIVGITNVPLPGPDKLVDFAQSFPALDVSPGVVIDIQTKGYEHVPGLREKFGPVVDARTAFTGAPGLGSGFSADLDLLIGLGNQITYIKQVYDRYGYTGDADLQAKFVQVEKDQKALGAVLYSIATKDVTVVPPLPSTPSLNYGSPQMVFSTPAVCDKFGARQEAMTYDVVTEDILHGSRIASVTLGGTYRGDNHFQLACFSSTTYERADGTTKVVTRNIGDPSWTRSFSAPLDLQPGDQLVQFDATVQSYDDNAWITSLAVTKRARNGTTDQIGWPQAPPSDPNVPTLSTSKVPAGQVVVGFFGTSSAFVSGWMTTTFSSAYWDATPRVTARRAA